MLGGIPPKPGQAFEDPAIRTNPKNKRESSYLADANRYFFRLNEILMASETFTRDLTVCE